MTRQSGLLQRGGCALSQFVLLHVSLSQIDLQIFLLNEILATDESSATDFEFSAFEFAAEVEGPCAAAM